MGGTQAAKSACSRGFLTVQHVPSTIVAGQRTFAEWHDFLDNPILADAILDRMSQQAYKIQLKGDSRRRPL